MSLRRLVKTETEIAAMRVSGQMLAAVLNYLTKVMSAGMTTKELADMAAVELKKLGGQPAFLGYEGFPDVICISVNEQLEHAIPGDLVMVAGDVVSLDFGVTYNGMITDGGVTVGLGKVSSEAERLMAATKQALDLGVAQVGAGVRVGAISRAVERRLLADKLGVVEDLIGHGVGRSLHEEPGIPNYTTRDPGPKLLAGMTIAIEPMATLGGKEIVFASDGWTISTVDGSLAAQFEHTVLVTESGSEVLTKA